MRGLQGCFPRFRERLLGNPAKWKLVIQSIVLVHNFRTEIVGLNQIRTVFDLKYMRGTSHCMVMTGSEDTTLVRMMWKTIH
jgi:hypothetical protein